MQYVIIVLFGAVLLCCFLAGFVDMDALNTKEREVKS
jgi:hypothetical protein